MLHVIQKPLVKNITAKTYVSPMHIVFCAIKLLHKEKEPLKTCFDTELISTPGFIIPHLKMN